MASDELTPRERKVVRDQILLSALITMGVTLMAIGISIHLTAVSVSEDNPTRALGLFGTFVAYEVTGVVLLAVGLRSTHKTYGIKEKTTPKAKQ